MGPKSCPTPGQESRRWSSEIAVDQFRWEGGTFVLEVTGLPADAARCWPSGGAGLGGLTMSEDGGLDEVEEFFRAAASCSWRRATVPSSASTAPLERPTSPASPTVRARLPCLGSHEGLCYTHGREYPTPVNAHRVADSYLRRKGGPAIVYLESLFIAIPAARCMPGLCHTGELDRHGLDPGRPGSLGGLECQSGTISIVVRRQSDPREGSDLASGSDQVLGRGGIGSRHLDHW